MASKKDAAVPVGRGTGRARDDRAAEFELGSYFQELRRRLDALEKAQLVERLVAYAGRLGAGERERLLAALGSEARSSGEDMEVVATTGAGGTGDPALLDDVASFVAALEGGDYVQGWGWDDAIGDERMWGDESWALEMDVLFARADRAFYAGELELAREAYEELLSTFVRESAIEGFCGAEAPEDMVDTDVSEAKARYFRSIYLTEEPDTRAQGLLLAVRDLAFVGREDIGVRAMADADAAPLPGQDAFLEAWMAVLERPEGDPGSGWARVRKWLLREAAERGGGVAGLEALARREGARHPEAYADWMRALLRQGRIRDALMAGREGMTAITGNGGRAWLADAVADLAALHGDIEPALAAAAARVAWRAEPTAGRLLRLYGCQPPAGGARERLIDDELVWLEGFEPPPAASVSARLELLAGRYEAAASRLKDAPPLGWSGADHPGRVAVPGLLAAALGADVLPPAAPSRLAELWEAMDRAAGWPSPWLAWERYRPRPGGLDRFEEGRDDAGAAKAGPDGDGSAGGIVAPPFSLALVETLRRRPLPRSRVERILTLVAEVAHDRVEAIVRAQHRGAYRRAAGVVAACAEGLALTGRTADARSFVTRIREEFRRFYAFRGELDAAVKSSTLLGSGYVPVRKGTPRRRRAP